MNSENQKEKIEYEGKIFQVVTWEGLPGKRFEKAVRAPGTRILAEVTENGIKKIVLTQEKRREANGVDYRLPGGKVFNSLEEYKTFIQSGEDIGLKMLVKAQEEAKEEAGIEAKVWKHLGISSAGASVDWDLHYFLACDATLGEQELEESEKGDIVDCITVHPKELYQILQRGQVQEGRTAAYLWKWLAENGHINVVD